MAAAKALRCFLSSINHVMKSASKAVSAAEEPSRSAVNVERIGIVEAEKIPRQYAAATLTSHLYMMLRAFKTFAAWREVADRGCRGMKMEPKCSVIFVKICWCR